MRRLPLHLAVGSALAFLAGAHARAEAASEAGLDALEKRAADEETARALERALIQRGALVLGRWTGELEPSTSYRYVEQDGVRRDTFGSALTLRLGLPLAAQAEVRVPFVVRDRAPGAAAGSGLGDVEVGLTKLVLLERPFVPELLFTARWKTTTGATDRQLPTGTGANALQGVLTAVKRHDPLVLLGSASYVWNVRSGDVDLGDGLGAALAAMLAATPDASVLVELDLTSFSATTVAGGQRVPGTDRLVGVLGLGVSTVVVRNVLLGVTVGVGVTAAAPDVQLTVTLPVRL